MEIKIDDLSHADVIGLLEEHLADMYATSPPESVHALDIDQLKSPEITFFSAWLDNNTLMGCLAIKELDSDHAELKSMRTSKFVRKSGVVWRISLIIYSNLSTPKVLDDVLQAFDAMPFPSLVAMV